MTKAMATPAREMDPQHRPMACLLAAPGPARGWRRRQGRPEWVDASSTPDSGLAGAARVDAQLVETPLAPLSLRAWRGAGPMAARFLWGRRRNVREVHCESLGASAAASELQTSIDKFLQPKGMLMVLLGCRQQGGPHSVWPTCGGLERRRCGLSWSRALLTLLTRRDPSGDDAMGLNWPIFCRGDQAQTMRRERPGAHCLRRRGPRSARGVANGWHRGDRRRCKLDVAAWIRPPRGAVAQTNGSEGAWCAEPVQFASRSGRLR